jgi:hypothetical protein
MLTFTCPSCHKGLKAPEALAGRKVKCPACQHPITVPSAGATPHGHAHSPAPLSIADAPAAAMEKPPEESEEPTLPRSGETEAAAGMEDSYDEGPTEPVSGPAHPASVNLSPAVEKTPEAAPHILAPPPKVEPSAAVESRSRYFAPAGYAATDPRKVPFKAPGLRRRLARGDSAAWSGSSAEVAPEARKR